jgi:hypothetical protein
MTVTLQQLTMETADTFANPINRPASSEKQVDVSVRIVVDAGYAATYDLKDTVQPCFLSVMKRAKGKSVRLATREMRLRHGCMS